MVDSPPSFENILLDQHRQHRRQTSTSSSNHSSFSHNFNGHGQPLHDEPPSMSRPASSGSMHAQFNEARQRTSSTASSSLRHQQFPDLRQDSMPFEGSTLENTARKRSGAEMEGYQQQQQQRRQQHMGGPSDYPHPGQPYDPLAIWQNGSNQFGFAGLDPNLGQYHAQIPAGQSAYMDFSTPGGDYTGVVQGEASRVDDYGFNQGGGYGQVRGTEQVKEEWIDDRISQRGSYDGGLGGNGFGTEAMNGGGQGEVKVEDVMKDLLESLSRSVSREPSPSFQEANFFQQQQQQQQQQTTLSAFPGDSFPNINPGSRSTSPFQANTAPSPSYTSASIQRPGSSPSNPNYLGQKPHSPPALVMPFSTNAPSPVSLPPIVTQPSAPVGDGGQGQGHALANQAGAVGGLLPPTNPALQHLSGMMGISPIAPSADGPQIFVQPSTPISGLKDGRGHFDDALRRAAQQNHHHQQSGTDNGPQQYTVPLPNRGNSGPTPQQQHQQQQQQRDQAQQQQGMDFAGQIAMQNSSGWGDLGGQLHGTRPRAKSDSYAPSPTGGPSQADFERQAMAQIMAQAQAMGLGSFGQDGGMGQDQSQGHGQIPMPMPDSMGAGVGGADWRNNVDSWLTSMGLESDFTGLATSSSQPPPGTVNPNQLPGNDQAEFLRQLEQQHQLSQLQAQRVKANPLSVNTQTASNIFKYEPGEFSPTSLAFYQARGMLPPSGQFGFGSNSAPFYNTSFQPQDPLHQQQQQQDPFRPPSAQSIYQTDPQFLAATPEMMAAAGRRVSFGDGSEGGRASHHAQGAGTPGYGMGFTGRATSPFGPMGMTGRVRSVSPGQGHRRGAKSEDLGRGGWGLGHGGSTTEFLNSITANDGSLIPPIRGGGRSHSRHSSVSSGRSASPALSVSSHGSSFSYASGSGHGHMDMPDGMNLNFSMQGAASGSGSGSGSGQGGDRGGKARLSKMKVTSMATEVAATSRRTNSGIFQCPVPGCGSTFTRHFNLKGHMRSHNDERPYKCLYDGCPKAEVGFARQHDCKRHMLLHQGLRPFECEGCHKKFARLDALTRHHKSEQGIECAIAFPLPVNPDGSAMSENQYKAFKAAQGLLQPDSAATPAGSGRGKKGRKRTASVGSSAGRSGDEEGGGFGSGMEEYDRI